MIEVFGICVIVVCEDLLDVVIVVLGSGLVYYFLMIEEMICVGIVLGLIFDEVKVLIL